jgi:nicotinamide phosphoribosyltransferase
MSLIDNPLLASDSYKYSHFQQYPEGATYTSSYIEARGTSKPDVNEVVLFGLQKYIKDRLLKPITKEHVEEARAFCEAHGEPFNYDGWMIIVNEYNGMLPVRVMAVAEGTPVPLGNALVVVENADDRFPWLPSFLETEMLRSVWYGSTVATLSREIKKTIKHYLDQTADDPAAELPFKLHDFGARGVSSEESAQIGGAAHLVNFMGTDTVSGIAMADAYYKSGVCGFSIPAAEHSTMTMRGRDNEQASYQAMIDAYAKPGKIFAVVSDSYDIFNAVRNIWCKGGLLAQVKAAGATVVIRPDSGDPILTPVDVIDILMQELADEVRVNDKGYKVLPDYVRVIQGDGIDDADVEAILSELTHLGYSASNIAFGMGGGLLQKVNRDTFKFAMKCSAALIDGKEVDVFKDPVTDAGKKSKKGALRLMHNEVTGEYRTFNHEQLCAEFVDGDDLAHEGWNLALNTVYELEPDIWNGEGYIAFAPELTFDEVRANAEVK